MSEWDDIERTLKQDAEKLSFEFRDEYWDEVASSLDAQESEMPPPFEFKDEYWDEVSEMLDDNDRKKRRGILFYITSGVAAIALLFVMFFNSNDTNFTLDAVDQDNVSTTKSTDQSNQTLISDKSSKSLDTQSENQEIGDDGVEMNAADPRIESNPIAGGQANPTNVSINTPQPNVQVNPVLAIGNEPEITQQPEIALPKEPILVDPNDRTLNTINSVPVNFEIAPSSASKTLTLSSNSPKYKPRNSRLFLTTGVFAAHAPEGNSEDRTKMGFGGFAGVGYALMRKRMEFRAGVTVGYRSGLNHDLIYNRRYYGTQLYEETDEVYYKGLSRVELPLELFISRGRNMFGFGVTPVWNAGVNSTYHAHNSYNNQEILVRNNYGIRDGVNDFDVRLSLSYEMRLTQQFSLGAKASYGLLNQVDTDIFQGSKGLNELSGGVYLKYNILAF